MFAQSSSAVCQRLHRSWKRTWLIVSLCAVFRNLTEVDTTADISLSDYLPVKDKAAVYVPHTAGRYQKKRFRKASCPLVERLVNALMFAGRNTGKKL